MTVPMARTSSGIDFCTAVATVIGTAAFWPPPPRPDPVGVACLASPPEHAAVNNASAAARAGVTLRDKTRDSVIWSLESQGVDRIQGGRLPRRIETEKHAGHRGEAEGERHGVG